MRTRWWDTQGWDVVPRVPCPGAESGRQKRDLGARGPHGCTWVPTTLVPKSVGGATTGARCVEAGIIFGGYQRVSVRNFSCDSVRVHKTQPSEDSLAGKVPNEFQLLRGQARAGKTARCSGELCPSPQGVEVAEATSTIAPCVFHSSLATATSYIVSPCNCQKLEK